MLDATNISVWRLASRVSLILKGKNKPHYSPNLPIGDGVIIINTDNVKFSGNKNTDKKYYKHTGHPGGIKEITPEKLIDKNKSDDIVKKAIKGMLPNSPLFRDLMKNNLKIYRDTNHPHVSQNPKTLNFKSLNRKNEVNV